MGKKKRGPGKKSKVSSSPSGAQKPGDAYSEMAVEETSTTHACVYEASSKISSLQQKVNHPSSQPHFKFFIIDEDGDPAGRRVISSKNLEPGDLILSEEPIAYIIKSRSLRSVCSNCFKSLTDPTTVESCKDCQLVGFCSKRCSKKAASHHSKVCAYLPKLPAIAMEHSIDLDLLAMALAFLMQRPKGESEKTHLKGGELPKYRPTRFYSDIEDLRSMVAHQDYLKEKELRSTRLGAQKVLSMVPDEMQIPVEELVSFLCQVNSNCHGLSIQHESSQTFAIGMYPLCAVFNHSCYPNAAFSNEGTILNFRALRKVKKGEEICVSYADLLQGRSARRFTLLKEKNFVCNCRRCLLRPNSEEERQHFLADKYLDAIACRGFSDAADKKLSSCSGYFFEVRPAVMPESKEEEEEMLQGRNDGRDAFGNSTQSLWRCDTCNRECDWETIQPYKYTEHSKYLTAQASSTETATQIKLLENYAESSTWHPGHNDIFKSNLSLINLYQKASNWKERLKCLKTIVKVADQIVPKHFLPNQAYFRAQVTTYSRLIEAIQGNPHKNRRVDQLILKRYKEEQLQAAIRWRQILHCSVGKHNDLTKAVEGLVEALEQASAPTAFSKR